MKNRLVALAAPFMFGLAVAASLVAGANAWAAVAATPQLADAIGQQLDSKDAAQIQQATATIRSGLQAVSVEDRTNAVHGLAQKGHWLEKLKKAQQHGEVVQMVQEATLAVPSDVWLVEYLQDYRARALLKLGRGQEALAAAKGLFNIARMQNVAADLSLIVDCLKAAYPGDDDILDRFAQEQVAGAALTPEHPTSNIEPPTSNGAAVGTQSSSLVPRCSVLDNVQIDATPYEAAIQQHSGGTDYDSLLALGNLLLLADRPKEARPVFERARALASPEDLRTATESIARCIKAEDGTIGRANAWVLSIRPSTAQAGRP